MATAQATGKNTVKYGDLRRRLVFLLLALVVALLAGLVLGEVLDRRIPDRMARRVVIVIAVLGGVTAIVHGLA